MSAAQNASETIRWASQTISDTHRQIADSLAWAIQRELKAKARDSERERLAEAIEEFLR